jgi:hypothetical protein
MSMHSGTDRLETFVQNELCPYQLKLLWFQDGATIHKADFHASQADSFLVLGKSPGQPTGLILHYQCTSFAFTSKARYMKHVLPKPMT